MDVPDDIRETVTRICPATGSVLFTDIAEALMAERERCAKIADRNRRLDGGAIAAAIRSGNRRA